MLDALDSDAVRAWSAAAVAGLRAHRAEINALNVFPVPDSDTGNNLLTTFRAADEALAAVGNAAENSSPRHSAADLLLVMASGAAQGASGNSGFIASQILRGLADAAADADQIDGPAFAEGLSAGASLGRGAVVGPIEGTILTVARTAADAALAQGRSGTLAQTARAAYTAAEQALALTPEQLAELAAAGVVDAGGRGLVVVLGAFVEIVTGEAVSLPVVSMPMGAGVHTHDPAGFGFEVQYLLDASTEHIDALRDALDSIGDSVVIVPVGAQRWNVHVHVDDVGAAIEAGVEAGRPRQISVISFAEQVAAAAAESADSAESAESAASADSAASAELAGAAGSLAAHGTAVVAIAPGPGLAHLLAREGVQVVEGSATDLPSVEEVLDAMAATNAGELVLLPNASRVTGVAEAAADRARARGLRVAVVPTRSPVQGLAAIAVHDASRGFDDDVVAMAEAAAATRFAEITVALDEALTAVGICQPGDTLGLIDGEVVEIGRGLLAVAFGIVDRLLGVGVELMTVVIGADAPPRTGAVIEAHVRERSPLTDVAVYEGGQPDHPVIIGVE